MPVAEILVEQRLQALMLELEIAILQEYLETRHELISWLESIEVES